MHICIERLSHCCQTPELQNTNFDWIWRLPIWGKTPFSWIWQLPIWGKTPIFSPNLTVANMVQNTVLPESDDCQYGGKRRFLLNLANWQLLIWSKTPIFFQNLTVANIEQVTVLRLPIWCKTPIFLESDGCQYRSKGRFFLNLSVANIEQNTGFSWIWRLPICAKKQTYCYSNT